MSNTSIESIKGRELKTETVHDVLKQSHAKKRRPSQIAAFGNGNNDALLLKTVKAAGGLAVAVDFKMEDLRLVRSSPSAATLVFRETIDGKEDGKPFAWHINSSSGYVKRDGKWVPILYQDVMAK